MKSSVQFNCVPAHSPSYELVWFCSITHLNLLQFLHVSFDNLSIFLDPFYLLLTSGLVTHQNIGRYWYYFSCSEYLLYRFNQLCTDLPKRSRKNWIHLNSLSNFLGMTGGQTVGRYGQYLLSYILGEELDCQQFPIAFAITWLPHPCHVARVSYVKSSTVAFLCSFLLRLASYRR